MKTYRIVDPAAKQAVSANLHLRRRAQRLPRKRWLPRLDLWDWLKGPARW